MSIESSRRPLGLRERKKVEAQRTIRRVALELFATDGYEAVSVEQIAAGANVSRTTFFNYFPSKEAVVTQPDPEALSSQRTRCAQRPAGEPLWQALSSVLLGGLVEAQSLITAQKQLKTSSPVMASIVHTASERMILDLREWAEDRVPSDQSHLALLELNVALAALTTAFEQWQVDDPFDKFRALAEHYLNHLGQSFEDPTPTSAVGA